MATRHLGGFAFFVIAIFAIGLFKTLSAQIGAGSGLVDIAPNPIFVSFHTNYYGNDAAPFPKPLISEGQTTGSPDFHSHTLEVNGSNYNSSPWYLICPDNPNQFKNPISQEYFYNQSGPYMGLYQHIGQVAVPGAINANFISGNACHADSSSLQTTVTLLTQFYGPWSQGQGLFYLPGYGESWGLVYTKVLPLVVSNAASFQVENIAFSPLVDTDLSNAYGTNSYIFEGIHSQKQHDIWSWNAKFANFLNSNRNTGGGPNGGVDLCIGFDGGKQAGGGLAKPLEGPGPPALCTGLPALNTFFYIGMTVFINWVLVDYVPVPVPCPYIYLYTETLTLEWVSNNYINFSDVIPPTGVDTSLYSGLQNSSKANSSYIYSSSRTRGGNATKPAVNLSTTYLNSLVEGKGNRGSLLGFAKTANQKTSVIFAAACTDTLNSIESSLSGTISSRILDTLSSQYYAGKISCDSLSNIQNIAQAQTSGGLSPVTTSTVLSQFLAKTITPAQLGGLGNVALGFDNNIVNTGTLGTVFGDFLGKSLSGTNLISLGNVVNGGVYNLISPSIVNNVVSGFFGKSITAADLGSLSTLSLAGANGAVNGDELTGMFNGYLGKTISSTNLGYFSTIAQKYLSGKIDIGVFGNALNVIGGGLAGVSDWTSIGSILNRYIKGTMSNTVLGYFSNIMQGGVNSILDTGTISNLVSSYLGGSTPDKILGYYSSFTQGGLDNILDPATVTGLINGGLTSAIPVSALSAYSTFTQGGISGLFDPSFLTSMINGGLSGVVPSAGLTAFQTITQQVLGGGPLDPLNSAVNLAQAGFGGILDWKTSITTALTAFNIGAITNTEFGNLGTIALGGLTGNPPLLSSGTVSSIVDGFLVDSPVIAFALPAFSSFTKSGIDNILSSTQVNNLISGFPSSISYTELADYRTFTDAANSGLLSSGLLNKIIDGGLSKAISDTALSDFFSIESTVLDGIIPAGLGSGILSGWFSSTVSDSNLADLGNIANEGGLSGLVPPGIVSSLMNGGFVGTITSGHLGQISDFVSQLYSGAISYKTFITDIKDIPGVPALLSGYQIFQTPIYPYLDFKYGIGLAYLQAVGGLSLSYDIFSPWNYYTPYDSEDMFPIGIASVFFIRNDSATKERMPGGTPVARLAGYSLLKDGIGPDLAKERNMPPPENPKNGVTRPMHNPVSIAALSNDYMFVLSQNNQYSFDGEIAQTYWQVSVIRLYPHGYHPPTFSIPDKVTCEDPFVDPNEQDCIDQWNKNWDNYWGALINEQNRSVYVTRNIGLNFVAHNTGLDLNPAGSNIQPYNITVDNRGNLYVLMFAEGCYVGTYACEDDQYNSAKAGMAIVKISNAESGSLSFKSSWIGYPVDAVQNCENPLNDQEIETPVVGDLFDWSIFNPGGSCAVRRLTEIAASPAGSIIYITSPSDNNIYAYSASTLEFLYSIPLVYSKYAASAASLGAPKASLTSNPYPLDYILGAAGTQAVATLSVTEYLKNGGLYGNPISSVVSENNVDDFDQGSFHHPLAIQEVNGYLYVLDNWQGVVGPRGSQTKFNILILRALNSTGLDVPISGTFNNDMFTTTLGTCQLSNPDTGNTCYSHTPTASFCKPSPQCTPVAKTLSSYWSCGLFTRQYEYECLSGPTQSTTYLNLASADLYPRSNYPPFGWVLSATITPPAASSQVKFCVQSSPNCNVNPDTLLKSSYTGGFLPLGPELSPYEKRTAHAAFTVNYNNTLSMIFKSTKGGIVHASEDELLFTNFNVENYTKVIDGTGDFACYTENSDVCDTSPVSVSNFDYPLYLMSDPFLYLEGLGSQQTLAFENTLSALSTAGLGSPSYTAVKGTPLTSTSGYGTGCVSQVTTGGEPSGCPNYPSQGSLSTTSLTALLSGRIINPSSVPIIQPSNPFLQTAIHGFLILPYKYYYQYSEEWTQPTLANAGGGGGLSPAPANILSPGIFQAPSPSGSIPSIVSQGGLADSPLFNPQTGITNGCTDLSCGVTVIDNNLEYWQGMNSQQTGIDYTPGDYRTLQDYMNSNKDSNDCSDLTDELQRALCKVFGIWRSKCYISTLPPPPPRLINQIVYWYYITSYTSPYLTSNVEGGDTYLRFVGTENNYYTPSLSSITLAPQIPFTKLNNRKFGGVYMNETSSPYTNDQFTWSATAQLQYVINFYQGEGAGGGCNDVATGGGGVACLQYDTISSQQFGPDYGSSAASDLGLPKFADNLPSSFNYQETYSTPPGWGQVTLFEWYKNMVYDSPLNFYLTPGEYTNPNGATESTLGYHRLIYVFNDRFNNTIYAPFDVDFAYGTVLSVSVDPVVSASNPSQTGLHITGTASYSYTPPGGAQLLTPLQDAPIYIYYGSDINYMNYEPLSSDGPGMKGSQLCTFAEASKKPNDCEIANPNYKGKDPLSDANLVNYHPAFTSGGVCPQPPQDILTVPKPNCNIYGELGLSAFCPKDANGNDQYCVPSVSSTNGDGICTTQYGLMNSGTSVTTDASGRFSFDATACGIEAGEGVIAAYYGDGTEPIAATEAPLTSAANPSSAEITSFDAISYTKPPSSSAASFPLGSVELAYGSLNLVTIIAGLVMVLSIIYIKSSAYGYFRKRRISYRRHQRK